MTPSHIRINIEMIFRKHDFMTYMSKFQSFWYSHTIKVLKIRTPKMVSVSFQKPEQFGFTEQ